MDGFQIISVIARGSHGNVYLSVDANNIKFALKELDEYQEVKLVTQLEHENIIKAWGYIDANGQKYLAMNYCPKSLAGLIDDGLSGIPVAQAYSFISQIFQAIEYIHSKKIIHRDITPSNILISKDQTVKLADFGIAKDISDDSSGSFTPCAGTLWYRAPEVLFSMRCTSAVDIWSAGCVVFEIFTLSPLFPGKGDIHQTDLFIQSLGTPNNLNWPGFEQTEFSLDYSLRVQPVNRLPEMLADCPSHISGLLTKLLVYDPSQRLSAACVVEYLTSDTRSRLSSTPS